MVPGSPAFSIVPGIIALVLTVCVVLVGPHLPRWALAPLSPLGVGLIATALATTHGAGDGAVLYMWPVLWSAFFFGCLGTISIVGCVGIAHALVLLVLATPDGYPARWLDVMVSVSIVAAVVQVLATRNAALLARTTAEARIDPLTGLLNRRGFSELAHLYLARAEREDSSIAVATFDVDHFKVVNDEWGHEIGDRVLSQLATVLVTISRDTDLVARAGGEEFVVLLPGSDAEHADAFTQRVRSALAAVDDADVPAVRVSAGVAAAISPTSIEGLLRDADQALYSAKRAGRDRTVVFHRDETAVMGEPIR